MSSVLWHLSSGICLLASVFGVTMKLFAVRIWQLVAGLFLFALGIVLMIMADIGYAPWEVFHVGLALSAGISIGMASIIAGVFVVALVTVLGEKLGLGTILSMVLTGVFIDMIMFLNIIPRAKHWAVGIMMLILGLFIVALGSYFYIKSAFGAGPRDNLMVVLNRKTKLPVGVCRSMVEFFVTLAGWLLGGMVGVGTVISVVAIGFCVQIIFGAFKFDATAVNHETLRQTYRNLVDRK